MAENHPVDSHSRGDQSHFGLVLIEPNSLSKIVGECVRVRWSWATEKIFHDRKLSVEL